MKTPLATVCFVFKFTQLSLLKFFGIFKSITKALGSKIFWFAFLRGSSKDF